jgi:hypothetical protein
VPPHATPYRIAVHPLAAERDLLVRGKQEEIVEVVEVEPPE